MPVIKNIKLEYRKTKSSTGIGWIVPSDDKYMSLDSAVDILCAKNLELFIKNNLGCYNKGYGK